MPLFTFIGVVAPDDASDGGLIRLCGGEFDVLEWESMDPYPQKVLSIMYNPMPTNTPYKSAIIQDWHDLPLILT